MTSVVLTLDRGAERRDFPVQRDSITIGSAPISDICLSDDPAISRVHAEIRRGSAGQLTLVPVSGASVRLNGKSISGHASLAAGDRIAIGAYVFAVRHAESAGPEPPPASTDGMPAARRMALPLWLIAYFAVIVLAFAYFLVWHTSSAASFETVERAEAQYAERNRSSSQETDRVLRLLAVAQVSERQGDRDGAYELYRDVLGARTPADPRSPAYKFAVGRMIALRR